MKFTAAAALVGAAQATQYMDAYNNYKAQHCVTLWKIPGFRGYRQRYCLDSENPTNFAEVARVGVQMNDQASSIAVGPQVHANLFQHQQGHGWNHIYAAGYKGKIHLNDQVTSMKLYKKGKVACLFDGYHLKGKSDCYPYNEKTGVAEHNLHYWANNQGDTVSSVWVPAGVDVQLFEHPHGKGHMDEFSGPARYNIDAKMNDKYSWIKVCRGKCPAK